MIIILLPIVWLQTKNIEGRSFYIRQSKNEEFGVRYNDQRAIRGLVALPNDWYTEDTSKKSGIFLRYTRTADNFWYHQTWRPKRDQNRYGHFEKQINRNNWGLVSEIDRFRCCEEENFILEIRYFYRRENNGWEYDLYEYVNEPKFEVKTMRLIRSQVDSVFESWGIETRLLE